ncbi:MAG: 4Fe-4S binding protein [Planctomycetota bacterium]|nr:4Fe-4S binding protein [Planctomycetota bacterium]
MDKQKVRLLFSKQLVDKPIISSLVRECDVTFNIFKAYVTSQEGGVLLMELGGEEAKLGNAIAFLRGAGVEVQLLNEAISIVQDNCTHCGACTGQCPTDALTFGADFKLAFAPDKCIACELCVPACPYQAISPAGQVTG